MKILCWVYPIMEKEVMKEYLASNLSLVNNLEMFTSEIPSSDLIIISAHLFNDLSTDPIVYKTAKVIYSFPEKLFHLFLYNERSNVFDNSCCTMCAGVIGRNENVIFHNIDRYYTNTIQHHIDFMMKYKAKNN
jgi:catalase